MISRPHVQKVLLALRALHGTQRFSIPLLQRPHADAHVERLRGNGAVVAMPSMPVAA